MTSVLERIESLPPWGIEPVPPHHRSLSTLDIAILWGDLGIGLLVLVAGALLVPALGFVEALAAIIVGSVIGVALLALGAVAGADHGVPTMVLFRPILGLRGSWLPSALNAMQLVGWTAVEFWAMSLVADLVSQRVFGFSARGLWLAIAAVICTVLALWGPIGVVRVWMKRGGAWIIGGILALVTILLLTSEGIGDALSFSGAGGWPTFGLGVDLVIAMPISWLPLVADYTRFARGPRSAGIGTFAGYLVANVWLYALGVLLVLSQQSSPDPSGIAAGVIAIAGGSIAGILFLVGLLVGETDEAFADMYSGAVCLQNIFPRASQRALTIGIAAVSVALAGTLTMAAYESFLFLIGSVFVPLFGILAAEYFVLRRRALRVEDLYRSDGRYWFTGGVKAAALIPWIAGFVVYHWIAPVGPAWWTDGVGSVLGSPLSERFEWIGGSLPSFAVAFSLALVVPRIASWPPTDRIRGEK
ncbi:MAG: purine-cytosine permease family protein [Actinomycetota bacterium]